jgi:hypothetical protein
LTKPAAQPTNRRTSGINISTIVPTARFCCAVHTQHILETRTPHINLLNRQNPHSSSDAHPSSAPSPNPNLRTHNRSHARPQRNAATATRRPSPKLRARPLHRLHDVEGAVRHVQLTIAHRSRLVGIHGAGVPKRRFAVPVE